MNRSVPATKLEEFIKRVPLLNSFEPSALENLIQKSTTVNANKGQILFLHEEQARNFYIMQSGWVKLFRETLDGTQAVIDVLTTNHVFGETAIFENDQYPYSAEIVEPSRIVSIPLSLLKSEIEQNSKIAYVMMSSMARYRRQQDQEIEHRTIQNASQRIGCFLLRLTNQEKQEPTIIHLPYDKTLIAARLGMQPETFSRALSKLKKETGIDIKGSTITIDALQQLSQYSCSACSSEFPCKDIRIASSSI